MPNMFYGAHSFNQPLDRWDVSSAIEMHSIFAHASSFNQPLDTWDVSSVTYMSQMFYGASSFNQPLDTWDVSSAFTMYWMFRDATSFNQSLDKWDVSSVTEMHRMFRDATSFNQPLDTWNVSSVTSMYEMFFGVNLSIFNYDATLNSWSNLTLQTGISFDGGNSKYSMASAEARDKIINTFGWTITDGGLHCDGYTYPSSPQNLKVFKRNEGIELSWGAPKCDGGINISEYRIYRSTTGDGHILIGSSTTLFYSDATTHEGITYYYVVRAVNSVGEGIDSNEVIIEIPNPPITSKTTNSSLLVSFMLIPFVSMVIALLIKRERLI
jgi:surface protein